MGYVNSGDTIIILDPYIENKDEQGVDSVYAVYDYIKFVEDNFNGYVLRRDHISGIAF